MRNLLKISLLAVLVGIFASGCEGCGDKAKPAQEETIKAAQDSPVKGKDTSKAAIDTAKKDTSKKK